MLLILFDINYKYSNQVHQFVRAPPLSLLCSKLQHVCSALYQMLSVIHVYQIYFANLTCKTCDTLVSARRRGVENYPRTIPLTKINNNDDIYSGQLSHFWDQNNAIRSMQCLLQLFLLSEADRRRLGLEKAKFVFPAGLVVATLSIHISQWHICRM